MHALKLAVKAAAVIAIVILPLSLHAAPRDSIDVLHTFLGSADGANPGRYQNPAFDSSGNLYGATYFGGNAQDYGTVFRIKTDGTKETLYTFSGISDGARPSGTIWIDASGDVFGTGQYAVFELVKKKETFTQRTVFEFGNYSGDGYGATGGRHRG